MTFVEDPDGRIANTALKMARDRIAELELQVDNAEKKAQDATTRFNQNATRIYSINVALEEFFRDGLDRCSDDDRIYFSLDHINELLASLQFDPISRIREWTVEGTITQPFSAVVKAASEDEAREMVENGTYYVKCDEYFESFDASPYRMDVDIDDVEPNE